MRIVPRHGSLMPSSRQSACLIRSQDTTSNAGSDVTKLVLTAKRRGGSNDEACLAATTMNCPDALYTETVSGKTDCAPAKPLNAKSNATVAKIFILAG